MRDEINRGPGEFWSGRDEKRKIVWLGNSIVNASSRGSISGSVGVGGEEGVGMDGTWSLGDPAGFWTRAFFGGEGTERAFWNLGYNTEKLSFASILDDINILLLSDFGVRCCLVDLNCSGPRGHQTKPLCNGAKPAQRRLLAAFPQVAFGNE